MKADFGQNPVLNFCKSNGLLLPRMCQPTQSHVSYYCEITLSLEFLPVEAELISHLVIKWAFIEWLLLNQCYIKNTGIVKPNPLITKF